MVISSSPFEFSLLTVLIHSIPWLFLFPTSIHLFRVSVCLSSPSCLSQFVLSSPVLLPWVSPPMSSPVYSQVSQLVPPWYISVFCPLRFYWFVLTFVCTLFRLSVAILSFLREWVLQKNNSFLVLFFITQLLFLNPASCVLSAFGSLPCLPNRITFSSAIRQKCC